MRVVLNESVAYLGEKLDRSEVVIFYLGDYRIFLVHTQSKQLDSFHHLLRETLASKLGDCYHDIDFGLIVFHPVGEEQIYVPNHLVILFCEDYESVLFGVLEPGFVIFKFLLQS